MAATLDAGPSASLAREKRHTGCAQNFALTCGPTNVLPAHRAAWTATSPFLNGSQQIPHVVTSSRSAILAAGFAGTILGASVLVFPMLDLHIKAGGYLRVTSGSSVAAQSSHKTFSRRARPSPWIKT
jgi:hypothetical protein